MALSNNPPPHQNMPRSPSQAHLSVSFPPLYADGETETGGNRKNDKVTDRAKPYLAIGVYRKYHSIDFDLKSTWIITNRSP